MLNKLAVNDLARLEEGSEWTPLSRLLDLSELLKAEGPTARARPAPVCVISILYISFFGLMISVFAWLRFSMSPQGWKNEQGKPVGEMLTMAALMPMFIWSFLPIVGAVLLFRLKKGAVYLFGAAFAIDIGQDAYNAVAYGWRSAIGEVPTIPIIVWVTQIAVIFYSIQLIKKGTLK